MRIAIVTLSLLGLVVLQLLIGGTRPIYALAGILPIALAAALSIWPRLPTNKNVNLWALLSTFLFIGYIIVRNRVSPIEFIAREQFLIAVGSLMVYLLFTLILTGQRERIAIYTTICVLALAQVIIGAIQFKEQNQWMPIPWLQRSDDWWRASGLYISPNHFAGFLEITAVTALAATFWSRFKIVGRVLSAYIALVCIAGIAISGSRGGYVSLAAALTLLLILSLTVLGRLKPEKLLPIGLGAAAGLFVLLGGAVVLATSSEFVTSRLSNIADTENMRLQLWDGAMKQFELAPILGTGSATYIYFGRIFRPEAIQNDPIHVHNDYLHLLAEYGLVGAGLFILFLTTHIVVGLISTGKLCKELASVGRATSNQLWWTLSAICSIGAITVHSIVDFNMHILVNALIIAGMFGVIAGGIYLPTQDRQRPGPISRVSRVTLFLLGVFILVWGGRLVPSAYLEQEARVALRDNEPKKALEYAEEGLKTDPNNPDLYYYGAEAARFLAITVPQLEERISYSKKSMEMFEKARTLFPYDSRLAFKYSHALSDAGLYAEALLVLDEAEILDPHSYLLPAYRGVAEMREGYYEEAIEYFRESLKLRGRTGKKKHQFGQEFDAATAIRLAQEELKREEAESATFTELMQKLRTEPAPEEPSLDQPDSLQPLQPADEPSAPEPGN